MAKDESSRVEIMLVGLGGMGVLTAGQLVACAVLPKYKYVSWVPSYSAAVRGGFCECTVLFSDEEITSPLLDQVATVLLFDGAQMNSFAHRVSPGGLMIVESAGLKEKPKREDFKLVPVAGLEVAMRMGDGQLNNMVLLGVYTAIVKAVSADLIEEELARRYASKEAALKRNRAAFQEGLKLAKEIKL
jgi:2-oxoglutarate ferredoxin oxidoreductase subunit gamma